MKKLDRPEDVAKLVIFDTWVRNIDRYAAQGDGTANRDNLLFAPTAQGKFRMHPIDHASCFVSADFDELAGPEALADKEIYGLFPEFRPYLTPNRVADAIEQMLAIPADSVRDVVNSVPPQWGVTAQERDRLAEMIIGRAPLVAGYAPPLLVDQPAMLLGGK